MSVEIIFQLLLPNNNDKSLYPGKRVEEEVDDRKVEEDALIQGLIGSAEPRPLSIYNNLFEVVGINQPFHQRPHISRIM